MIYMGLGFLVGLFIPYIARRFAKFMPATPGYALVQIFKFSKKVSSSKRSQNPAYSKMARRLFYRSLLSGLVMAVLVYLGLERFGQLHPVWFIGYFWVLLLLAEIDSRMLLLPDILTVPLLIAGFALSAWSVGFVSAPESALGAVCGYFLPVAVSLLFVWKNKDAFGGGDIKLLAALGGWLGVEPLLYVILFAAVLFLAYAAVKRQRSGAFGPALAIAGIIVALYFF